MIFSPAKSVTLLLDIVARSVNNVLNPNIDNTVNGKTTTTKQQRKTTTKKAIRFDLRAKKNQIT